MAVKVRFAQIKVRFDQIVFDGYGDGGWWCWWTITVVVEINLALILNLMPDNNKIEVLRSININNDE